MAVSDQQIVTACSPILEAVDYHPENTSERIFLNAYHLMWKHDICVQSISWLVSLSQAAILIAACFVCVNCSAIRVGIEI
jgi:hypothetical protein